MSLHLPRTLREKSTALIALALFFGAAYSECIAQNGPATLLEKMNGSGEAQKYLRTTGSPIFFMVYSPDGNYLISALGRLGEDIAIWKAATGKLVRRLPGHKSSIQSIRFLQGDEHFASASFDGSIIIWRFPETPRKTAKPAR